MDTKYIDKLLYAEETLLRGKYPPSTLFKKWLAFYGTLKFIIAFAEARCSTVSRGIPI
jgi:hypothetical protein